MKARIGDYIKTPYGPRLVIEAHAEDGYVLETGEVLGDSDITYDDILLESEVIF